MTSFASFRSLHVLGPAHRANARLWGANLAVAMPGTGVTHPPIPRNPSVRLLQQDATPERVVAIDSKTPEFEFHVPLHLVASAERGGTARILHVEFTPVAFADAPPLFDLRVAPADDWPPRQGGTPTFPLDPKTRKHELQAPDLTLTSGLIRLALGRTERPASKLLGIDWSGSGPVHIFGNLLTPRLPGDAVLLDFIPDGIEFHVQSPDPFAGIVPGGTGTPLDLQLRLVPAPGPPPNLRLDLVGGATPDLQRLAAALAWLARDLAANGSPVALAFDGRGVPPLSWRLEDPGAGPNLVLRCGKPDELPGLSIREDAVTVRLLTAPDPLTGAMSVAELLEHRAQLDARSKATAPLQLTIRSAPKAATADAARTTVRLSWLGPDPTPPAVEIKEATAVVAATAGLADRLADTWRRSGALSPGQPPRHAFAALDRGWAQLELPKPTTPPDKQAPSAFTGAVRAALTPEPDERGAMITVTNAATMDVHVTWTPATAGPSRSVSIDLTDAQGSLDGVLWAGMASPSATEILPPLNAGPAALADVPLVFGAPGTIGWPAVLDPIKNSQLDRLSLKLEAEAIVWRPPTDHAAVSSIAMTRTAHSATEPSATRGFVPVAVSKQLVLSFRTSTTWRRLPECDLPESAQVWGWPWPAIAANLGGNPASPPEGPAVSLASLTLPGVEFTFDGAPAPKTMRASLRYDLPILDELHANATPPGTKTATGERAPTALDPEELQAAWAGNARRLAAARTEADRVAFKRKRTEKAVTLWHTVDTEHAVFVPGLVQPRKLQTTLTISLQQPAIGQLGRAISCLARFTRAARPWRA